MPALKPTIVLSCLLLLGVAFAGCHADSLPATAQFTARDFEFDGPDELPSGWVTLEFMNEGPDIHHLTMMKLDDGVDFETFRAAAVGPGDGPLGLAAYKGGSTVPAPGGVATSMVFLEPGVYAAFCEIPDSQGTPHYKHGMLKEVVVMDEEADTEEPDGDVTVTLDEFSFALSKDIGAGEHVVQVDNVGGIPHEAVLVALDEGHNTTSFLAALGAGEGPPPGRFVGGTAGFGGGETMYFPTDLEPGRHTFICFLFDPNAGAPHFALGMTYEFDVV